jgi:hypothetical protein
MTDPYEIAITTYALTLCDSTEKEFAFHLLHSKKLEVAGIWSLNKTETQIGTFQQSARCYHFW